MHPDTKKNHQDSYYTWDDRRFATWNRDHAIFQVSNTLASSLPTSPASQHRRIPQGSKTFATFDSTTCVINKLITHILCT